MSQEAGPWVCGNCRSINREGTTRCYSCRTPRALALSADGRDTVKKKLTDETPAEEQAAVARGLGATYRPTSSLALLAQVAVYIVTAITLARAVVYVVILMGIDLNAIEDTDELALERLVSGFAFFALLTYVAFGAWFLGFVAWGAWLARVVGNIPALGGGWPHATPRSAFLTTLVPGGNLYWTTSIIREAIEKLSPKGEPRLGVLTAWWLTLAPGAVILMNTGPLRFIRNIAETAVAAVIFLGSGDVNAFVQAGIVFEVVGAILLLAAAGLAIRLILVVEGLQESRRAALAAIGPVPPVGAGHREAQEAVTPAG